MTNQSGIGLSWGKPENVKKVIFADFAIVKFATVMEWLEARRRRGRSRDRSATIFRAHRRSSHLMFVSSICWLAEWARSSSSRMFAGAP